jgi:hypothetical protein
MKQRERRGYYRGLDIEQEERRRGGEVSRGLDMK